MAIVSAASQPASQSLPSPRASPAELRRFLEKRFPGALAKPSLTLPTGIPPLDEALGGSL